VTSETGSFDTEKVQQISIENIESNNCTNKNQQNIDNSQSNFKNSEEDSSSTTSRLEYFMHKY